MWTPSQHFEQVTGLARESLGDKLAEGRKYRAILIVIETEDENGVRHTTFAHAINPGPSSRPQDVARRLGEAAGLAALERELTGA